MDELECWLILARTYGIHASVATSLAEKFGSLRQVFTASPAQLTAAGLSVEAAAVVTHPDLAQLDADLRWLERSGSSFVSCHSTQYPSLLRQLSDAPVGLFVRGNVAALSAPQLAVVGSRNPTARGRETAASFAAQLARCGLAIASGLATGIDAASHEGALRTDGVTVAVCATGLDVVYPTAHMELAERIVERGALVSEFPPRTALQKFHFPRRNRLISGISLGTLVVEAAVRSGSLITAKFAAEQGREVFAIPGSIHNPMARGCHVLLRQGAKLVESVDDILSELGPLCASLRSAADADRGVQPTQNTAASLDKDYKILLDALGFDPAGIDRLVERSGLRAEAVASMLLILELDGRIESMPGALYVRVTDG